MPAQVNNPRAADELRREYNVLGDRLNLRLDDVVVPVAVVADLTAGSSGVPIVRRAYARFMQVAVVGEYSVWRFEVPPGIIAVVRQIHAISTAAAIARVHFGSTIAAPANVAVDTQLMDGRLRAQGRVPSCRVSYGTQVAAVAAPYYSIIVNTALGAVNTVEWLCGSDNNLYDFIEFNHQANQQVNITMEWDEILVA